MADELSDNVIHQILPEDHGRLWMSTNPRIFWLRQGGDAYAHDKIDRFRPVFHT